MSQDFLASVEGWLEKSGHAFELRCARAFRAGGAKPVDVSFAYADPNTGTLREGDILASFGWTAMNETPASIEVVAECKSGREHPWVAFYDQKIALGSRIEDWAYKAHGPFAGVTEPLAETWIGQAPFDRRAVASHVVAAFTKDSVNPAGDSVRQVLSAAEARWQRYVKRQHEERRGCVIIPVVVTGARLVECRLDAQGSTTLEETSSLVVAGPRLDSHPARVFVITEAEVETFSTSLRMLARMADTRAPFF